MSEDKLDWTELAGLVQPKIAEWVKLAGNYPRLMQIMHGRVPTIHTFGILSVDNPQARVLTPEQNNKRRLEFRDLLKQEQYGYVQPSGKFGGTEQSFFVMNCRKEAVVRWGKQFDQESVIFGTVDHDKRKTLFEYLKNGQVISTCEVVQAADDANDYYTIYKGRKFQIPFVFPEEAPPPDDPKLSFGRIEVESAFRAHLAVLDEEAEFIQQDAAGKVGGMGVLMHRSRVASALRALSPWYPTTVLRAVYAETPRDIQAEALGTAWTTNAKAAMSVYDGSREMWLLSAEVDPENILQREGAAVTLKQGTQLYFKATKLGHDPRWGSARFHGKA